MKIFLIILVEMHNYIDSSWKKERYFYCLISVFVESDYGAIMRIGNEECVVT